MKKVGEAGGNPKKRKVTLADIAREAGVSPATASMVLNAREGVSFSRETVRKVFAAAASLDYALPGSRRSAVFARRTILIVTPNVINPYYATLVQAVQQAATEAACDTLVQVTYRDRDKELAALDLAERGGFDGVLFTMMAHPEDILGRRNPSLPLVVIADRTSSLDADTVELNNFTAGCLVARHMIELGHSRIAYLSTTLNAGNSARIRRLEGLQSVWREACPHGSVLVRSRDIDPNTELHNMAIEHLVGLELARECLNVPGLTGFVAVNDMVAYGAVDAIRAAGLRVPEDYSVCGFDNIFPSGFAGIALTTVEHHMVEKAHNAFAMLQEKFSGTTSRHNITRVEFAHHLIRRASTAPPRS